MSRPRIHHPRQHQINIRFATREYIRIHHHASLTGKTVTEFARAVMLRRPRTRPKPAAPVLVISRRRLARWHALGCKINDLAHDANLSHEFNPRALSVLIMSLRALIRACFAEQIAAGLAPRSYRLAPALRYQLRKICTNLVQIADGYRHAERDAPAPLSNLIARLRLILNGDADTHGA